MKDTKGWIAAGVVAALSVGAALWWRSEHAADAAVETATANASAVAPPERATPGAAAPRPALVIGEYRPDSADLLPIDAPLAQQVPLLKAAAANGNATAACRLAVIGSRCAIYRRYRGADAPPPSAEYVREMEESLREQYADVSLDALPERYRAYAQGRLDTEALSQADGFDMSRRWGARCADAPAITQDETLAALRQAALAGHPESMVRYASGLWSVEFAIGAIGTGFTDRGQRMAWLRSPGFDQWRSDAAAVRRLGLERGDPEMLWMTFSLHGADMLTPLERADPIEQAAALRAYAALVGGHAPESTVNLGLTPAQAAQADALSDAWAARARERGRSADHAVDRMLAIEVSACD